MNERDRGNDSIFLTTLIVEEGGKRTLQDVRVASKSLLDNKQRDPPTTWPPFFLLLTRKSSMLGAMPICSKKTTYNVTIKGEGWHGKNMFFFSPGGTVGGTNATRLHYCTVALSFVRVSRWWEAMARLANKEGPPRIGKF